MIGEKYLNLKDIIGSTASTVSDSVHDTRTKMHNAKDIGAIKMHDAARRIDDRVQHNPWAYIAGVAAGSLVMGYMMGHHRSR